MPVRPPTYRPSSRASRQASAEYDRRRGGARDRGYDARWDKEADQFKRSNPRCLGCKAVGESVATMLVDHILPHKGDPTLMWDKRNWQPACRFHHDVVKQRLETAYAAGRVSAAALRLDSREAIAMTMEIRPPYTPGGDGQKNQP